MSESLQDRHVPSAPEPEGLFQALFRRSRPFLLLAVLLLKILLTSLSDPQGIFAAIMRAFVLVAAVLTASDTRRHLTIGLCLGLPALIMLGVAEGTQTYVSNWIGYLFAVFLYLYIISLMLRKIFHTPVVTLDTIGLALCCYVLLGQVWVLFYAPVIELDPQAFSVPLAQEGVGIWQTVTYFSYVTLTTLGYGDISPVSPVARALAVLEALTGTLFLAVLIARLIGTYGRISNRGDGAG